MTFEEVWSRDERWLLWQVLQRLDVLTEKVDAMDAQTKQELDDLATNEANLDAAIKGFAQLMNQKLSDLQAQFDEAVTAKADLAELQDLVHTSVAAAKVSEDEAFAAITANTPAAPTP